MMLDIHKKTPITKITVTDSAKEKGTLAVTSSGWLVWKASSNYPTQDVKLTLQLQQNVNMQLRLTGINADVKVARDLLKTRLKDMSVLPLNKIELK